MMSELLCVLCLWKYWLKNYFHRSLPRDRRRNSRELVWPFKQTHEEMKMHEAERRDLLTGLYGPRQESPRRLGDGETEMNYTTLFWWWGNTLIYSSRTLGVLCICVCESWTFDICTCFTSELYKHIELHVFSFIVGMNRRRITNAYKWNSSLLTDSRYCR